MAVLQSAGALLHGAACGAAAAPHRWSRRGWFGQGIETRQHHHTGEYLLHQSHAQSTWRHYLKTPHAHFGQYIGCFLRHGFSIARSTALAFTSSLYGRQRF